MTYGVSILISASGEVSRGRVGYQKSNPLKKLYIYVFFLHQTSMTTHYVRHFTKAKFAMKQLKHENTR